MNSILYGIFLIIIILLVIGLHFLIRLVVSFEKKSKLESDFEIKPSYPTEEISREENMRQKKILDTTLSESLTGTLSSPLKGISGSVPGNVSRQEYEEPIGKFEKNNLLTWLEDEGDHLYAAYEESTPVGEIYSKLDENMYGGQSWDDKYPKF